MVKYPDYENCIVNLASSVLQEFGVDTGETKGLPVIKELFAKKYKNMTVTNITDFRSNAKQYIDNVIKDNSALVINRGRTAAVLISLEEYNSIKETELLMSSRGYNCVKEGVEQYYNNDLVTVDIDDL